MEAAGEWKGREGGGNGGPAVGAAAFVARRPAWLATGGHGGDRRAWERRLRGLAARATGLAAMVISGSAALKSVARQSLSTSAASDDGRRHVKPLPRRHAWRGTGT